MNKGLGRKIIDLIEENKVLINENEEVTDVDIESIKPNPEQPRVHFDKTSLRQLAESIKEHGVIQPVILKPSPDGYVVVAGERRVRAAKMAGSKTVPAIVRDYNAIYLTELAILENIQRENLSPIEEADAYVKIIKHFGLTQQDLARKIGKSRTYVTNVIGLLNLPEEVREDVNKKIISMGHAKVLSKLDDGDRVIELARKVKREQMSVRRLEELARKRRKGKVTRDVYGAGLRTAESMEKYFESKLGERTEIRISEKEMKIKLKDENHLKRLHDIIVKD